MKKSSLLFAIVLFTLSAKAQTDVCKEITKVVKELQGTTTYTTPYNVYSAKDKIYADRMVKNGLRSDQIVFIYTDDKEDYTVKGLYFKLLDGTIIKNEEAIAECNYISEDHYLYVAVLTLSDEDKAELAKSPIQKFSVGRGDERKVDQKFALKFMTYIPCVFSDENK